MSLFLRSVILGVWSLTLPSGALTAQVDWTQRTPTQSPPRIAFHCLDYDAARDRTVLTGNDETWLWDGDNWSYAGNGPLDVLLPGMVYEAARNRMLLYGGQRRFGHWVTYLDDTWIWNGATWSRLAPSNRPPGLSGLALAYDSDRDRVVLFGGRDFNVASPVFDQTWEWDGSDWVRRFPANSPPGRYFHAMTYDRGRRRVVLFGGVDDTGTYLGDLWEWDGVDWLQHTPGVGPSERSGSDLVYDALRQRTVLFGGVSTGWTQPTDTWEWDGSTWLLQTTTSQPTGRTHHAMAFDSRRGVTLLVGGQRLADTWQYGPVDPATYEPFGVGCAGSAGTPQLQPAPFQRPWIGSAFVAETANLPTGTSVFMVTGFSDSWWSLQGRSLPAALAAFGMPGCTAYVDSAHVEWIPASGGTAQWTVTVPGIPALVGLQFFNQAIVVDPGANALGATVSNAARAIIGTW